MRKQLAFVLVAALGTPAFAGDKPPQLPEERRGTDPKPDTESALRLYQQGRYEDAIRQSKMALGRDEKYVPAMTVMAKSYYKLRKYELATSIIDIAKAIDEKNAELYNLLGFIALDAHNPPDRISATAAFKKATEFDDKYAAAWNNLAAQYLFSKNYDGALQAAQKAAGLAPNFAKAQLNLGSALRGKQQYTEADAAYKKALQLDPAYADAYFNLGILYLDAKEMPNMDLVTKLGQSINYLNRYQQMAGARLTKDDPAVNYIAEARSGIDKEQKRLQRLERQKQREQPKPAAAAPAEGGAAPAPAAAPAADGKVQGDK
jgi:tetratricopeptide (TPR) repeat protein